MNRHGMCFVLDDDSWSVVELFVKSIDPLPDLDSWTRGRARRLESVIPEHLSHVDIRDALGDVRERAPGDHHERIVLRHSDEQSLGRRREPCAFRRGGNGRQGAVVIEGE
jgi:hypothetical protein